ncbi:MAG: substrate-binding domain-containing protein, partial [Spirochaetia bacterium]|nr:substrate-binding domain-containing protein [Spirochaetia bacterium]
MKVLVQEIGGKAPGDAMPSIRELIRRTGLAHQTVVRAMEELERQGYLRLLAGKGAFVAERTKADLPAHPSRCPNGSVILAIPAHESHWLSRLVHLADIQAVRGGHGLLTYRFGPLSTWGDLAAFVRDEKNMAGLIIWPPADSFNENDQALIDSLGVPALSLYPLWIRHQNLRPVSGNPLDTGAVMANALIARGHRDLCFIRHQPSAEVQHYYAEGMRTALAQAGFPSENLSVRGEVTPNWDDSVAWAKKYTELELQKGLGKTTAFIYTTSLGAFAGARAILDAGLRIPEDVAVIGSTDHPLLEYAKPSIAGTDGNWDEAMEIAFAMLRGED